MNRVAQSCLSAISAGPILGAIGESDTSLEIRLKGLVGFGAPVLKDSRKYSDALLPDHRSSTCSRQSAISTFHPHRLTHDCVRPVTAPDMYMEKLSHSCITEFDFQGAFVGSWTGRIWTCRRHVHRMRRLVAFVQEYPLKTI
jgi:hypothetical protein